MKTRLVCGVLAVAMAGPCLGEEPAKSPQTVNNTVVKQSTTYSPSTSPPPVAGIPRGSAYTNRWPSTGNGFTCCGPGTQYLVGDCCLRLDLSDGIGLWEPCNGGCPYSVCGRRCW